MSTKTRWQQVQLVEELIDYLLDEDTSLAECIAMIIKTAEELRGA